MKKTFDPLALLTIIGLIVMTGIAYPKSALIILIVGIVTFLIFKKVSRK
jgi:hypothetical protein